MKLMLYMINDNFSPYGDEYILKFTVYFIHLYM